LPWASPWVSPRWRNEVAGATYHVYARGVDRRRIFVDDEDYETYTRLLGLVAKRQGWHLLTYCLMPNHVHLLIETPETNLANGMQWLQSQYALSFNRRHGRTGHLFECRYHSPLVRDEHALVETAGYIIVNPVAASLCHSASEWKWGSHAAVCAWDEPLPSWLAHHRLHSRLFELSGTSCYADMVETRERELRALVVA
jgi:putative transposase